jgi:signal transduction histidine kinase
LLANPEIATANRTEQLATADDEAKHLQELIDDAIEMARLDTARIEIHPELANLEGRRRSDWEHTIREDPRCGRRDEDAAGRIGSPCSCQVEAIRCDLKGKMLREVLASMRTEIDERPVQIALKGALPRCPSINAYSSSRKHYRVFGNVLATVLTP